MMNNLKEGKTTTTNLRKNPAQVTKNYTFPGTRNTWKHNIETNSKLRVIKKHGLSWVMALYFPLTKNSNVLKMNDSPLRKAIQATR